MWIVAIVSGIVVAIAHHLGFVEKAYVIAGDIAKCPMCSTMWGTLTALLLIGGGLLESIALSFIVAYLSNWFMLGLGELNRIYEIVWEKQNRKNKFPKSSNRQ